MLQTTVQDKRACIMNVVLKTAGAIMKKTTRCDYGLGLVSPLGHDVSSTWANLLAGHVRCC